MYRKKISNTLFLLFFRSICLLKGTTHSIDSEEGRIKNDTYFILCQDSLFAKQKKNKTNILSSEWVSDCWIVNSELLMQEVLEHLLERTESEQFVGVKFTAFLDKGKRWRIFECPQNTVGNFLKVQAIKKIPLVRNKPLSRDKIVAKLKKRFKNITACDYFKNHMEDCLFTKGDLQDFLNTSQDLIEVDNALKDVDKYVQTGIFLDICMKDRNGEVVIQEGASGELIHHSLEDLGIKAPNKLMITYEECEDYEDAVIEEIMPTTNIWALPVAEVPTSFQRGKGSYIWFGLGGTVFVIVNEIRNRYQKKKSSDKDSQDSKMSIKKTEDVEGL